MPFLQMRSEVDCVFPVGTVGENTELSNERKVFSLSPGIGLEYIGKELSSNVFGVLGFLIKLFWLLLTLALHTRQPNSRPADFKMSIEKNWEVDEGLVKCLLLGSAPKCSDLVNLGVVLRIFPLNGCLKPLCCPQRRLSFPLKAHPLLLLVESAFSHRSVASL